jgi:hypothetical protein
MDPRPWTWRELYWMFCDHQAAAWDHTALMVASWSSKPIDPNRLNPWRRRPASVMRPVELYALAESLDRRNREAN